MLRPRLPLLVAVAVVTSLLSVVDPVPAGAAVTTFTVDANGDADDAILDGTCVTYTNTCTLRAALREAKYFGSPVRIEFDIPGPGAHQIIVQAALPALDNGSAGITIDGFTQTGAKPNTDPLFDNGDRRIEIVGQGPTGFAGLVINGSNNTVRGLVLRKFSTLLHITGDDATNNEIVGNILGLRANGALDESPRAQVNEAPCVAITSGADDNRIGSPDIADRNVIAGCYDKAVMLTDFGTSRNVIQNNIIGLDPTGSKRRGARMGVDINRGVSDTLIGGTGQREGNVIAGTIHGIEISHGVRTVDNVVAGNLIGTDVTGTVADDETKIDRYGIRLEGEAACSDHPCAPDMSRVTVVDNVVVNTGSYGILVDKGTHDSTIARNRIGVLTGGRVVGVGEDGVHLAAGVFGITVGPDNVIAGAAVGVSVSPLSVDPPVDDVRTRTEFNTITRNSIRSTASSGVDLSPLGQANSSAMSDADVQEGVLAPQLEASGGAVVVNACPGCTVELFEADRGAGQLGSGERYVAMVEADSTGRAVAMTPANGWGPTVTATATTPAGSTSEFALIIAAPTGSGSPSLPAPTPAPFPSAPPAPAPLVGVPALRLLETRAGPNDTTFDGEFEGIGRRHAGTSTSVRVAGRAGVPTDATAVMLNVTAINGSAPGFVTVFGCGSSVPPTSNVNYFPGQVEPNAVLAPIGTDGAVCIFTSADVDLVVDVNGYVPAGSTLVTMRSARLFETRSAPGLVTSDGRFQGTGRLGAGTVTELIVAGRAGVPTDASSVFLNVTAINGGGPGFVTIFPCGGAPPDASHVNYFPGDVVPNAVLAKLGPSGAVCIFTSQSVDMVVDVSAHAPATSALASVVPARLVETRRGPNEVTFDGRFEGLGRPPSGSVTEVKVAGRGGVPESVAAVIANVTAVDPAGNGYLTVFPCGVTPPQASNVNYFTGQVRPNAVLAPVGADGTICIFTLAETDMILDVSGFIPTDP